MTSSLWLLRSSRAKWCLRWPGVRQLSRSAPTHATGFSTGKPTFEDLGLHPPIIAALQKAFPHVKEPTNAQAQFIPAILSGRDVLLKDVTGSGKSFGLVIALLNKPRIRRGNQKENVTSLVLVPHRDLGHQVMYWIERMHTAALKDDANASMPPLDSVVQLLVRDGGAHLTSGLAMLKKVPPHILVATPQAVLDVYESSPDALRLGELSSVVVDEVDYLITTIPRKDPERSFRGATTKAQKKLMKHPGATRELLDIIYAQRIRERENMRDERGLASGMEMEMRKRRPGPTEGPQLVVSSATLRKHLANYLYEDSGYLNPDGVLKVKGEGVQERTVVGYGGKGVTHHVLVVSEDGIRNTEGAVDGEQKEGGKKLSADILAGETSPDDIPKVEEWMTQAYQDKPSPFDPNALEAVATVFALDVASIALLVLPASAGVQRAVYELREMGVNAEALDGRTAFGPNGGEGRLVVCTEATIRGMDLPAVETVFVLGILEGGGVTGRSVDGYVHIAGRVGRLGGRSGKVISVVDGAGAERAIGQILQTRLGVNPVKLGYFD